MLAFRGILFNEFGQVLKLICIAPDDLCLGRRRDFRLVQLLWLYDWFQIVYTNFQLLLPVLRSSLAQILLRIAHAIRVPASLVLVVVQQS